MPRVCTICTHPQRDEIDQAILAGQPLRRIAPRYGVTETSLRRHRDNHLAKALEKARETAEALRAERLAEFVLFLRNEALSVYREARKAKRLGIALQALAEARESTAVLARLVGEIGERVEITLVESREWAEMRRLILETLDPFPEARTVLAAALAEYGGEKGYGD